MKNAMTMLAVVAVVGLAFGVAVGESPNSSQIGQVRPPLAPAATTLPAMTGTISKVDGEKVSLKIPGRARAGSDGKEAEPMEVTFVTDSKTEITLDTKAAKVSDLKEGQKAAVTYTYAAVKPGEKAIFTASKIEATSAVAK